jgi:hypothetical protein
MKSEGMLVVKIIEIDRQHTPTPRLCSSRAKGVDKDPEDQAKSGVHKPMWFPFRAFLSYLGFRVANTFMITY